jgi:acetyl-CoA carboxylase biotin carboxyl carrier protein
MTQRDLNQLGREHAGKLTSAIPAASSAIYPEGLGELLDQVRHHAVLFVSEVPRRPLVLRIRAGEVSIDVEWAPEHVVTASGGAEPAAAPVAESVTEVVDPETHYLTSSGVGVFYLVPEPGAAPFVSVGDTVIAGQQVGIIEAMKLMIPVEADKAGRVVEVLKNNGESVEYGERLFAFAIAGAD